MMKINESAVVEGSLVLANTPLAATKTTDGETHIFYAAKSNLQMIIHNVDGKLAKVVDFYPGSKVGATNSGNKVSAFYRSLNPVGDV